MGVIIITAFIGVWLLVAAALAYQQLKKDFKDIEEEKHV